MSRLQWMSRNRIQSTNNIFVADGDLFVCSCGLSSNSAIFQPYSDRTVVQFPSLTPYHGQLGVFFSAEPTLTRPGHPRMLIVNLLAIKGSIHNEGMPGIEPRSLDPHSSPLPLPPPPVIKNEDWKWKLLTKCTSPREQVDGDKSSISSHKVWKITCLVLRHNRQIY